MFSRGCHGLCCRELRRFRRKGRGLGCLLSDPRLPCLLMPSSFRILLGLGSGLGCCIINNRSGLLGVSTCLRDQFPGSFCLVLQLGHLHLLVVHPEYIRILCRVLGSQSVGLLMGLVGRVGGEGCGLPAVRRGSTLEFYRQSVCSNRRGRRRHAHRIRS